jgi:hypothetical protein
VTIVIPRTDQVPHQLLAATYTGNFMTTGVLDSSGQQIRVIEHASSNA